jgi:hypothetical protein
VSSLRDLVRGTAAVSQSVTVSAPVQQTSSFIVMLDKHLTQDEREPRRPGYHPSDLAYNFCPRLFALVGLGLLVRQKDVGPVLQRVFDNGHSLHDRYQGYTRAMGIVSTEPELVKRGKARGKHRYAQEVRLDHPVGITGNCDDVLDLDGFIEVVDYKSINDYRFKSLMGPVDYHEKQLVVYLGMVDHIYGGNPPKPLRGRMVYESKDSQQLKEFIVPWDDHSRSLFNQLVYYLEIVNQAVAQDDPFLAPCLPSCGKCDAYDVPALREKPMVVKI